MRIPFWIRKILLGYRANSEAYIKYIRKLGVKVGDDVRIFDPLQTTIDFQNPHLISIGNHVQMTGPITILAHDYSWCVLKRKYGGEICGNQKRTSIGSNVFIGWGTTILGGSIIGDNTIIGANSVVRGKLEGNAVYGGNPVRKIMSLEEFYVKRHNKQLDEAIDFVSEYEKIYGKVPNVTKMREYFFLFQNSEKDMPEEFQEQLKLMGNYEESMRILSSKRMFNGYDDFVNYYQARMKRDKIEK